ncbi:enoyl-[acyl-carrier-protein] reductase, mitochondrial-like [Lingula anatina]|uniref:Enoyl-[acyl-carrier-protein] reductase, mitochondrial n=1 Tax=Lingula anatina TaxID=7574 RepID=A0A1S3HD60_LINAN|nr:enoyl-[acyl-carrier-protein] reductase, mitochondrial-like [Lingula anatina]|eukprot:XP_013383476.2 enoyl-[acyl-carrier-protein] reductase, mitochondrial-like [Lingula anatina]
MAAITHKALKSTGRIFANLAIVRGKYLKQTPRRFSSFPQEAVAIQYRQHGDPVKVLFWSEVQLRKPEQGEVMIKMLAAPINPIDIYMIRGTYPLKTELPHTAGIEGVAEVIEVGEDVSALKKGDWVIPAKGGLGTWCTHSVCAAEDLTSVSRKIPLLSAATLAMSPCVAYRMLTDFADLKEGDYIIQNGANSSVGQAVIQIAAARGIRTINIVRHMPADDRRIKYLQDIGGTHVLTEEFLRSGQMKEFMTSLGRPTPSLALNGVGGPSATEMLRYLAPGSNVVTYGGMSTQPVIIPSGKLIFKDLHFHGIWMMDWNQKHYADSKQKRQMYDELVDLSVQKKLRPPFCELVPISDFCEAVEIAVAPFKSAKQIFVMDQELLKKLNETKMMQSDNVIREEVEKDML